MFKDMTDQGLDEAIKSLQTLVYIASETKSLRLGKLLRDLDIAIAVKRSRIRRGVWTGGEAGRCAVCHAAAVEVAVQAPCDCQYREALRLASDEMAISVKARS